MQPNPLTPVSGQDVTDWKSIAEKRYRDLLDVSARYEKIIFQQSKLLEENRILKDLLQEIVLNAKGIIDDTSRRAWIIKAELYKKIKKVIEK